MHRGIAALVIVALAFGAFSCSSGAADPAPAPTPPATPPTQSPPPDPPPSTPANVAGTWHGTFEASGLATRAISMLAFQNGTCVDGAWQTEPGEWTGAISGYADVGSFSGYVSLQRPADGPGRCGGLATFSGEVGADTITWTSSGFTGDCAGGLPQSVKIILKRG